MQLIAGLLLGASALVAASPLVERQSFSTDPNAPCGMQSFGTGPPSGSDSSFESNPAYSAFAFAAPAPKGYKAAFRNQDGSTQQDGYMGYYLLQTYNTTACGQYCDNANGCNAFNIYFERDPLLNPAPACPNPLPTTNIKCSLWGSSVSAATATNEGQYREQFHVVIAGSDGFNKQ
ncbi:hypothetical protein KC343_g11659 [Hortaea werneckii]|uniref:Apple domain-containing protein n=1 Tax=Hortaea werneckii TaxID=91943 RepID=A0A3M7EMR2_HORWE|nr:hypothetical protein KC352_g19276 [Hortaea werneckii]KAI7559182.1 hypothetical protein KC317_g10523 [Hortaea werneckii]KAI7607095.1 hypothetical protein KC346_g10220 [Hortaea werneckii]KAI7611178.1 hypothetical protein KC343_g11659 [Hortaea werneckii]KAI7654883.1 hypothetical protein KC319_g10160 [Hortaea werneckii]